MHSFVGNGIPPIPSVTYGYDQLDQPAENEIANTDKQHYYDSLTNMENASYQNIQESKFILKATN